MNRISRAARRLHGLLFPAEYYRPAHGLEIEPYLDRDEKQGIHHLARYHWACGVLASRQPQSVLDIACGAGFGSYLLASRLPEARVTGADYDPQAVRLASGQYQRPNLAYVLGDMMTWEQAHASSSRPLGKYDAIVSFETLEHLPHREIALMRVVANLNPGGALLLSTPCAHEQPVLEPHWEHHRIEYSYRDLQDLLRRFFRTVLLPENGDLPYGEYWTRVVNKDQVRYINKTNPVVCLDPIRFEGGN